MDHLSSTWTGLPIPHDERRLQRRNSVLTSAWRLGDRLPLGDHTLCVSAEASFGLAAILTPVGAYCVTKAWQRDRSTLLLAMIPLFFSIQQFCEGLVWVGVARGNPELIQNAALAFLFFALLFWLFWIPLVAVVLESRRQVRWVLGGDMLVGLTAGLFLYVPILLYPEILSVNVVHHSIHYDILRSPLLNLIPQFLWPLGYLAVVSLPFILGGPTRRGMIAFGTALVVSAAISHAYFWYSFASVWCHFAAALSLMLAYVFYQLSPAQDAGTTIAA